MSELFLHHVCIQTNDYEASLAFYKALLDMEVVEETPNFHGRDYNTWLRKDQFMIELQTPKKGTDFAAIDTNHNGLSHLCFWVKDLEQKYMELKQLSFIHFKSKNGQDIYDVNGGKLFKVIAPEGTVIEFRDKLNM